MRGGPATPIALLALAASLGCGTARPVRTVAWRPPPERPQREEPAPAPAQPAISPAVARAPYDPAEFRDVFRRAVSRLEGGGYVIVACDAERGSVETARRELELSCGGSTCLGRQSLAVLLGHRSAKISLTRELFDPAIRGWVPAPAPVVERDAERLLREVVARNVAGREREDGGDPCPLLPPPPPPAAPEPEPDPFADAPAPMYGERAASRATTPRESHP